MTVITELVSLTGILNQLLSPRKAAESVVSAAAQDQGGAARGVADLVGAHVARAVGARQPALVGQEGGTVAGRPRADGGRAGQQGVGQGRAAVVEQRPDLRVHVEQVGGDKAAAAAAVADQVIAAAGDGAVHVGAGRGAVAGEEGVPALTSSCLRSAAPASAGRRCGRPRPPWSPGSRRRW